MRFLNFRLSLALDEVSFSFSRGRTLLRVASDFLFLSLVFFQRKESTSKRPAVDLLLTL